VFSVITPSAGGVHHCQHVESLGGRYDGGTMVSQHPGDPNSQEELSVSTGGAIGGSAAPVGGLG
jgi:hypothetical protein